MDETNDFFLNKARRTTSSAPVLPRSLVMGAISPQIDVTKNLHPGKSVLDNPKQLLTALQSASSVNGHMPLTIADAAASKTDTALLMEVFISQQALK